MEFRITRTGVRVPTSAGVPAATLARMKRKLTVTTFDFNSRMITRAAWIADPASGSVYFARVAGVRELQRYFPGARFINTIDAGESVELPACTVVLNSTQHAVFEHLVTSVYTPERVENATSSCIINMQAGLGKTFLSCPLIARFARKTLIVVPDESLMEQWSDHLRLVFPGVRLGQQYGRHKTDGDIVVACVGSLLGAEFKYKNHDHKWQTLSSQQWFARFGFTVLDEIHMYCSPVRADVFRLACSTLTLGMSGTTEERLDGMDAISHHYCGEPVITAQLSRVLEIARASSVAPFKMCSRIVNYHGPPEFTRVITNEGGDTVSAPLTINMLADDPYRNQLVVNEITRLYERGHSVFVFVDRRGLVEHYVRVMREVLADRALEISAPELDSEIVAVGILGGADKQTRIDARDESRICILTYACGSTGLSYPRYTAAVYATPRRNGWRQILARITRLGSLVDVTRETSFIVDYNTTLKSQVQGFKKVARDERQSSFETTVVNWQDVTLVE